MVLLSIEDAEDSASIENTVTTHDEITAYGDHSRYKCCCKNIHIKTGATCVAIFYATIIISNLLIRAAKSEEVAWNWQLLFLVSDSVAVISLFYGIMRQHPAFLQPFTVLSIITISFCILLTIFYFSATVDGDAYARIQIEMLLGAKVQSIAEFLRIETKTVITISGAVGSFIYACTVFVHSWFMAIIVKTAQYFRELKKRTVVESEENGSENSCQSSSSSEDS